MVGRISSFSQPLYLLNRSLHTQAALADVQAQTASGLKNQTWGGYGWSASTILSLQADLASATTEAAAATSAGTVVEQAYATIGSLSNLTDSMLTALSGAADPDLAAETAQGWLTDLESLLNTAYAGQSLFAGTATDGPAVDLAAYVAGDADSYYLGSPQPWTYYAADVRPLTLSVSADDPIIANLVEAIGGLINGVLEPADALDAVREAAAGVGVLQSRLSASATRLEAMNTQATARADAVSAALSTARETDLAEATVLATQYETVLQTSFSTLNMLMSVKLSDYL